MITEDDLVVMIRGLNRVELAGWIQAGWVHPAWRGSIPVYREIDVARVRLIHEIRQDLGMAEDAVPVVLSLLDQIYGLRRELRQLCAAVQAQPEPVRRSIGDHFRRLHSGE